MLDGVNTNKKTAVLVYDFFCNFEISVALEVLALAGKKIVVFGKSKEPVCSEEGLRVLPDATLEEVVIEDFDSLILPGAADIRNAIEDDKILDFIKLFDGKVRRRICYFGQYDYVCFLQFYQMGTGLRKNVGD